MINSNSHGNCYILENERESLIIECGVTFNEIKQALRFNLKKVVGCIVTHEHGDHSKGIHNVLAAGINVYATEGTHLALGTLQSHRAITTFAGDRFKIGGFIIRPFQSEHDVKEPVGFHIEHDDCGKVLFLTDSYYCRYTFADLNNIIIEANHDQALITDPKFLRDRVITSHMSIKTCRQMLAANDLSAVQKIVLIHLSERNSNAKDFQHQVQQQTGKPTFIAQPGLVLPFNKKPF